MAVVIIYCSTQALKKFIKNVNDSPEASAILLNWNLRLAPECIQLDGRQLTAEKLLLGKNATVTVNAKADWGRESTNNHMLVAVELKKWAVIFVNKNEDVAKSFLNLMTKLVSCAVIVMEYFIIIAPGSQDGHEGGGCRHEVSRQ